MNIEEITKKEWADLSPLEKAYFDGLATKYQKKFLLLQKLLSEKKCFRCKTKFEDGLILKFGYEKNGEPIIVALNPKFLFHASSTHGIPADLLGKWFGKLLRETQ